MTPNYSKNLNRIMKRQATGSKWHRVAQEIKSWNIWIGKVLTPNIIEDAAPFTMEIGKYQNYGELLKNSVESYPLRDKVVLVMKDMVWVEQAFGIGAKKQEQQ